jgi:hypothetical protein
MTTSDSSVTLTIGDESFPVIDRQAIDGECLADPAHQLYLVTVDDGTIGADVTLEELAKMDPKLGREMKRRGWLPK